HVRRTEPLAFHQTVEQRAELEAEPGRAHALAQHEAPREIADQHLVGELGRAPERDVRDARLRDRPGLLYARPAVARSQDGMVPGSVAPVMPLGERARP